MPVAPPIQKGIIELLDANSPLKTPTFQRSYAWGNPEVDEYWDDLKRAIDDPGPLAEYFLGLVVLDDEGFIQDGQQRLATSLLFASAIFEAAEATKAQGPHDIQLARDIAGTVGPALRASPEEPLQIGIVDQIALLNRTGIRVGAAESTKRLVRARTKLTKNLAEDLANLDSSDSKLSRLKQWGELLRSGAYVVVLRVSTKDAHNIFETLNTRGVQLSNGDLIKSHLVGRSSNDGLAVAKWQELVSALSDNDGAYEKHLDSFLLHYFGSQYAHTVRRALFSDYRKAAAGLDSIDALENLIESARLYRSLVSPETTSDYWKQLGAGTQEAIELLNGLGFKQLRYLLLAVIRDFGASNNPATRKRKQGDAVRAIAAWAVRGLVIGRTGGSAEEKTYIEAAKKIREGDAKTVERLRQYFQSRDMYVVDDAVFKDRFLEFRWDRPTSHTRARAILLALERSRLGKRAGVTPTSDLTLEHVLPQSPADGTWKQFDKEMRVAFTYDLGNLLLIENLAGANNQLGVKEWSEKREIIKGLGHQTELTAEAIELSTWSPSTVRARGEQLAELAVRTWKP